MTKDQKITTRTGTETLVKQGRATAGTITLAARNGGFREWVMGGEDM